MATTIGSFLGFIFGAALLGALLAWLIRKLISMPVRRSYIIGVTLATILYMTFSDGFHVASGTTALEIGLGVVGGLLAFAILFATSQRVRPQ